MKLQQKQVNKKEMSEILFLIRREIPYTHMQSI